MDKTIIYYSGSSEDPIFEQKIVNNIKKNAGDIPIISVSQKPMDFGTNICVGNIGVSYYNGFKQALIGAKAAKTKYVIFTESDCLYSPDYFKFEPDGHKYYRYDNVWVVWQNQKGRRKRDGFRKKRNCEGMQIVDREYMIERFEDFLSEYPKRRWHPLAGNSFRWFTGLPCITFKTKNGLSPVTGTIKNLDAQNELPYWGEINNLIKEYL